VHQLSGYRRVLRPAEIRSVPVTDQVAGQLLSLPMYPGLCDADVDHVAAALAALARHPAASDGARARGGEVAELVRHTA
jgi:dTDP-4-amino-4,6-dideoxygalactose transaminase